jgi:hypothetical protein
MSAEIEQMLREAGLMQYHSKFLQAGLDNWESLCKITDSELSVLGVSLGHRRKLQREIARRLMWPDYKPLPTPEELLLLLLHNKEGRSSEREDYFTLPASWWSRESHTSNHYSSSPSSSKALPRNTSSNTSGGTEASKPKS